MANPVLKVILQAVDEVTGVAKKAQDSVSSFASSAKGALSGLAALGVGAALGAFFKGAIDEAAAAEVGMGRLATAVRNAGGNFEELKPQLEETVSSVMKLSTATDDDLRAALTNMITISGDVAGSQKNLALAADLAAFKHISLEEAAVIVAKAMNGNVTAMNKLGVAGKDATTVLENARASFGGFAAQEARTFSGSLTQLGNQWGEFKEAVGTAILSTGEMGGAAQGLVGVMAGLASWVEQNEGAFQLVTSAVGNAVGALLDVGRTIYEVVQPAIGPLVKILGGTLLVAINTAAWAVRGFAASFKELAGEALESLGFLVEKGGGLLKLFGVNVVEQSGVSMRAFGAQLRSSAQADMTAANATWSKGMKELIDGRVASTKKLEGIEADHGNTVLRTRGDTNDKAAKAAEEAARKAQEAEEKWNKASIKRLEDLGASLAKARDAMGKDAKDSAELLAKELNVNLGEVSAKALDLTTAAMERLLAQLKGKIPIEQWQALNEKLQQHKSTLSDLLPPSSQLAKAAKDAADENERIAAAQKKQREQTAENVRNAATLARAFVDAASATGVIDDKMANILNSAISLAESLPKAFGGDATSIAKSVVALANIIVGLGSSELEKKREANRVANTAAIERLTREVGNLNLRESGKTFAGIQDAVDTAVQARADARAAGKGPGAADQAAKDAFLKSLRAQGIGLEEARGLFKELFGRDLSMANASLFFQDIADFQQGLQRTEFGQFGTGFEGQLDAMIKGFDILGTTDADAKLTEFKALASKFSPALAAALQGDLTTPEGRAAATANLRDLFKKLNNGGIRPEDVGVSGPQFLQLIQDILPLLTSADGVGAGTASLLGGTTATASGLTSGVGGASGIGVATASLPTPDLGGLGAPVSGPISTTTINGGLTVNQYFPDVTDPVKAAESMKDELVRLIGADLIRQRAALGIGS